MKREFRFIWVMMFLLVSASPATGGPQKSDQTAASSKDACLACHGPYDKLAAATAGYVAPGGGKITPHRYVPHETKEAKGIPECGNCHQPHPLPPAASTSATAKPDVQWCFANCHHENNFESCKKCHK